MLLARSLFAALSFSANHEPISTEASQSPSTVVRSGAGRSLSPTYQTCNRTLS